MLLLASYSDAMAERRPVVEGRPQDDALRAKNTALYHKLLPTPCDFVPKGVRF